MADKKPAETAPPKKKEEGGGTAKKTDVKNSATPKGDEQDWFNMKLPGIGKSVKECTQEELMGRVVFLEKQKEIANNMYRERKRTSYEEYKKKFEDVIKLCSVTVQNNSEAILQQTEKVFVDRKTKPLKTLLKEMLNKIDISNKRKRDDEEGKGEEAEKKEEGKETPSSVPEPDKKDIENAKKRKVAVPNSSTPKKGDGGKKTATHNYAQLIEMAEHSVFNNTDGNKINGFQASIKRLMDKANDSLFSDEVENDAFFI